MSGVTDNPIEGAAQDLLERGGVAGALADTIRYVDASKGYVVGVLGPWGSGKTSLVNLAREQLKSDKPELLVLDFNPWMFSGAEQLVDSFFAELAAQLRLKGDKFRAIADDLDSYSELLTPLGLLPFVGGWFDRARGVASAAKKFQDKRKHGVAERRTRLSEELSKLEQPIVVVLDDIDRLTTQEIREVFKLVRLTASFPNVIYLLAFDRYRVEQALQEEGIDGRDYLEKIVQIVIDVPALPRELLLRSLTDALGKVIEAASSDQRFDAERWPDLLFEVILPSVRHMRDVRRLAASVYTAIRELCDQVELVDILALEAIRVFMPDTFGAIANGRDALTKPIGLSFERSRDAGTEKAQVEALVTVATRESNADAAKAIIERLFPAGSQHNSNMHYGSDSERSWLRSRRVAHKDVLQLYLERNANEDFTAFKAAEAALALASDAVAFDVHLRAVEPARLEKVITALEIYEGEFPVDAIVPMSIVLLNIMPAIPDRPRGMMDLMNARIVVTRVVLRALRQLGTPDAVEIAVNEVLAKLTRLSPRAELVQLVGYGDGAGHKLVSEDAATGYEKELAQLVRDAAPEALAAESELLRLLLAAERTTGSSPLRPDAVTPQLTMAILMSATGETKSQPYGSRAVHRSPWLAWEVLVSSFGGEAPLKSAIDATRGQTTTPPGYEDTLVLADKYLSGWRPKDFPFTDEDEGDDA